MLHRLTTFLWGLAAIAVVAWSSGVVSPAIAEAVHAGHKSHALQSSHAEHGRHGHAAHDARAVGGMHARHSSKTHGHAGHQAPEPASAPETHDHSGKAPCGKPWDGRKHCPPCYVSPAAISAGVCTRPKAAAKFLAKPLPPTITAISVASIVQPGRDGRPPAPFSAPPPFRDDLIILTGRLRI